MKYKKIILWSVWGISALLWVGIGAYHFTYHPPLKEWTIAVTIGAVALEVAFWVTAAILGVSVWQSRQAVWRFITRPFQRAK